MVSLLSMTSPNCAQILPIMQNFKKSEVYVNFDYHSTCPPIYDYLPIDIGITNPSLLAN